MYELMQPLLDFLTIKTGTIGGALLLAFIYWARNFLLKPFIFFLPRVQNRKFERQYLKSLEERERILTINGLGGSWGNDVELSSIYVPLKLGPRMSEAVNGEDSIACTPPNCDRFTTEDILLSNDRVTILGQPGSGKSTLVRYLALQHACNWRLSSRIKNRVLRLLEKYHSATQRSLPIPLKKRFPILVRLRTLQDERGLQLTVNDLPRLCAGDDIGARCPDEFFANHLRNGHCIVFLDGLDEIIETRRSRVREQIYNLVTNSDYKRNAFILTSRSTSYEKVRTFKEQFTCGFTYEDILLFAKKWYQIQQNSPCPRLAPPSNAIENTEKKAKALVDAIYQSDNARRLAVNPLLLSMLAVVHASDTSLPSRRAEFYQLCMPALLGDIALKRGLHVKFQPVVKEQILKPIAYWMHRTECKLFVEESKLRLQIAEQLPEVGYSRNASDIDEFYTETIGRGDVLMRVNSSENAFVHRTFQEYLAAKHIADLPNSRDIILYRLHDPWWEQVVLFYVGIISGQEAGEFIE
ncbi:MAG: NACHT domain-containing NTPase, partial [Thiohalomonadales bacterium]